MGSANCLNDDVFILIGSGAGRSREKGIGSVGFLIWMQNLDQKDLLAGIKELVSCRGIHWLDLPIKL